MIDVAIQALVLHSIEDALGPYNPIYQFSDLEAEHVCRETPIEYVLQTDSWLLLQQYVSMSIHRFIEGPSVLKVQHVRPKKKVSHLAAAKLHFWIEEHLLLTLFQG